MRDFSFNVMSYMAEQVGLRIEHPQQVINSIQVGLVLFPVDN